jgi:hypothetical protein
VNHDGFDDLIFDPAVLAMYQELQSLEAVSLPFVPGHSEFLMNKKETPFHLLSERAWIVHDDRCHFVFPQWELH